MVFLRLEISNFLNNACLVPPQPPFLTTYSSHENRERANVMTHTQGIASNVLLNFLWYIPLDFIRSNCVQSDAFGFAGRPVGLFFPALASWGLRPERLWERHLFPGVSTQVWPLELSVNLLETFALDASVENHLEGAAELPCCEMRRWTG